MESTGEEVSGPEERAQVGAENRLRSADHSGIVLPWAGSGRMDTFPNGPSSLSVPEVSSSLVFLESEGIDGDNYKGWVGGSTELSGDGGPGDGVLRCLGPNVSAG